MAKLSPYEGCRRSPGDERSSWRDPVKILWPLLSLVVTIGMAMSTSSGHAFG